MIIGGKKRRNRKAEKFNKKRESFVWKSLGKLTRIWEQQLDLFVYKTRFYFRCVFDHHNFD